MTLSTPSPDAASVALSGEGGGVSVLEEFGQAVAADLHRLARLHDREPCAETLRDVRQQPFQDLLGLTLRGADGQQALKLLDDALAELPDPVDSGTLDYLAVDYAAIYLNHTIRAYPAESVWVDEEHLVRQEPMLQVQQWYRRYFLTVDDPQRRSDDHLVHELQFLAHLFALAARPGAPVDRLVRDAVTFLDEHTLRWVQPFAARVATRCSTAYFAGLNLVTWSYLDELRDVLAEFLGEARPTPEEVTARLAPKPEPKTTRGRKGGMPLC